MKRRPKFVIDCHVHVSACTPRAWLKRRIPSKEPRSFAIHALAAEGEGVRRQPPKNKSLIGWRMDASGPTRRTSMLPRGGAGFVRIRFTIADGNLNRGRHPLNVTNDYVEGAAAANRRSLVRGVRLGGGGGGGNPYRTKTTPWRRSSGGVCGRRRVGSNGCRFTQNFEDPSE